MTDVDSTSAELTEILSRRAEARGLAFVGPRPLPEHVTADQFSALITDALNVARDRPIGEACRVLVRTVPPLRFDLETALESPVTFTSLEFLKQREDPDQYTNAALTIARGLSQYPNAMDTLLRLQADSLSRMMTTPLTDQPRGVNQVSSWGYFAPFAPKEEQEMPTIVEAAAKVAAGPDAKLVFSEHAPPPLVLLLENRPGDRLTRSLIEMNLGMRFAADFEVTKESVDEYFADSDNWPAKLISAASSFGRPLTYDQWSLIFRNRIEWRGISAPGYARFNGSSQLGAAEPAAGTDRAGPIRLLENCWLLPGSDTLEVRVDCSAYEEYWQRVRVPVFGTDYITIDADTFLDEYRNYGTDCVRTLIDDASEGANGVEWNRDEGETTVVEAGDTCGIYEDCIEDYILDGESDCREVAEAVAGHLGVDLDE